MSRRILLVEDNQDIAKVLSMHLKELDGDVQWARDGITGLKHASSDHYDLLILDLMLPGLEGLELCRRLRAQSNFTPILMLTAKSSELDRVIGLEMGADDYLTKPFSIPELLARVKAIFRRSEVFSNPDPDEMKCIEVGKMTICIGKRTVTIREESVDLTAKEFDLLVHFARHPGQVYTRSQLLDLVWGYSHTGYEHTVNSHINRLRRKIEPDLANPTYILTVWGVGYKFNEHLTQ